MVVDKWTDGASFEICISINWVCIDYNSLPKSKAELSVSPLTRTCIPSPLVVRAATFSKYFVCGIKGCTVILIAFPAVMALPSCMYLMRFPRRLLPSTVAMYSTYDHHRLLIQKQAYKWRSWGIFRDIVAPAVTFVYYWSCSTLDIENLQCKESASI